MYFKLLLALLLFNTALALHAQETATQTRTLQLGFAFTGIGQNDILTSDDWIGGPGYQGDGYNTFSLLLLKPLNHWLSLESGIDYSRHTILVSSAPMPEGSTTHREKVAITSIPLTLRLNFLRFFHFNGGVLLDIDSSIESPIESQTGMGILFGPGLHFQFGQKITLFADYQFKIHSLLPFQGNDNHQKIAENGLRIGFTIPIHK